MPSLRGPGDIALDCNATEIVVITTDPPKAGVKIKARESNRDVNARPAEKTTDDQGAAEFEVICINCPGTTTLTFTGADHAAYYMKVSCSGSAGRGRREVAKPRGKR